MVLHCSLYVGPDTKDVLMYLAGELGEEWKKLAMYLNLKSVRIQAILRQNNMNPDPRKVRYDMLVTWAKRIPRSVNKVITCIIDVNVIFVNCATYSITSAGG